MTAECMHETDGANSAAIRCLIADDQAMIRESFAAILAAQPGISVAGQAADGAQAVREAARLEPDVVLMDVGMPVMDGLAAAREILADGKPGPRVLMLTTFDLDDYVYEALRAGASGFLLKDAGTSELIRAVRIVAAGDALLAPSVTRRLVAGGLSNGEISQELVIAEQTTKAHVGRILAKLNLRDRAQAVVLAYETGLVTPGGLPRDQLRGRPLLGQDDRAVAVEQDAV